jgi:hypothetical protein
VGQFLCPLHRAPIGLWIESSVQTGGRKTARKTIFFYHLISLAKKAPPAMMASENVGKMSINTSVDR